METVDNTTSSQRHYPHIPTSPTDNSHRRISPKQTEHPRRRTRLVRDLDVLPHDLVHARNEGVDRRALAHVLGVLVQQHERHVRGQALDLGPVQGLGHPLQDRLKRLFVPARDRGPGGGPVLEGGEHGDGLERRRFLEEVRVSMED